MDNTQIYAAGIGTSFVLLALINFGSWVKSFLERLSTWVNKYLVYSQALGRHRYVGPWSPADVALHCSYIAINALCMCFKTDSVQTAGLRAGTLSLINAIPFFASFNTSFTADILGIRLATYLLIHRAAGIMSVILLLSHVLIALASRDDFPLNVSENLWGLIVRYAAS
jgi:hypothetical protein